MFATNVFLRRTNLHSRLVHFSKKHARVMVTVQLTNEIKKFDRNEIDEFRF